MGFDAPEREIRSKTWSFQNFKSVKKSHGLSSRMKCDRK